jgi:ABC-type multidrug transport system ATPase subunit
MKQKLALCCALIHKPKVLFLDEPTTGVDPVSRKEFWEMLKRLQQKGITILVSTPYMDEAALCDRIALIQKGSILRIDTPENIINKYDKTIYDVQAKNMHQLILDLKSYPSQYSVFAFGDYIHYIDKKGDFNPKNLQEYLEKNMHSEIEIRVSKPTIEDVFMDL